MPLLQALSTGKHRFLCYSNMHWRSRCANAVPNVVSFSPHFIGVVALIAPALQVQLPPIMWCNVFCCQAMDAQPQRLGRPEFSPLHHCSMLTTSGTKPPWQGDKAGARVFLAEKKQAQKRDPVTPQADHTWPLRKHFHPHLRRHTSQPVIPKYICLLWWRAVTLEREMCYCEWNPFRSFLSLSGKMYSDRAMGGSMNFWNAESRFRKRWLSLFDAAAALCHEPGSPAAQLRCVRVQQFGGTPPAFGRTPGRAGWEGDVMYSCHSSRFSEQQNGTAECFFPPVWHRAWKNWRI